ncbi:Ppx/GppA family phosphatase [candidate division KSB1 bacterium]|nr:Ppx/GppA family phosphatase [candidate division KSB1 bacterium]
MSRYAVIDVGSNSVLLLIAEKKAPAGWKILADRAEITRLGAGLQTTHQIQPAAMERTLAVFNQYLAQARAYPVSEVLTIGTMALRTAQNAADFLQKVKATCGLEIEVIDGQTEARLAYLAVKAGLGLAPGNLLLFDVGGGSTEFIIGRGEQIRQQLSLNLGIIRITEQHLKSDPVTEAEVVEARRVIAAEFNSLTAEQPLEMVVGMAGTVTTLAAIQHEMRHYEPQRIHGSIINRRELDRQIAHFQRSTLRERQQIIGLEPKRADVILAGALIVASILTQFQQSQFTVSDWGVRHGLLVQRFGI